jgi:hypothetical protein
LTEKFSEFGKFEAFVSWFWAMDLFMGCIKLHLF